MCPRLLYAVHVKSEAGEKNRPAQTGKMGAFGEVDRGPRGKNEIALTFDAGAEAECFDDLIAALASAHASSTFFITGRFVHDHADCAAEITKHGHEVGNHTWSHLNLTQQSDDVVRDEIMRSERAIVQASGQSPRPRFASPVRSAGQTHPENRRQPRLPINLLEPGQSRRSGACEDFAISD